MLQAAQTPTEDPPRGSGLCNTAGRVPTSRHRHRALVKKFRLGLLSLAGYRDVESGREHSGGLGETFCKGEEPEREWHLEAIEGKEPLPGAAGNSNGVSSGSSLLLRPTIKEKNQTSAQICGFKPTKNRGKGASFLLGPIWTWLGDLRSF